MIHKALWPNLFFQRTRFPRRLKLRSAEQPFNSDQWKIQMIDLHKMSETEYREYRKKEIMRYAQMNVESGKWKPSDSYRRAESALKCFLPSKLPEGGLFFLTIVDTVTGNSVGTMCYGNPPNQPADEYYVYDIRIFDEHKRKKYGQTAFDKLEEKLRNIGIKKIILDVSVDNEAAIPFYQKMGYTITNYRMKKAL
jgi:ribosomal protein S18 acetylase RimI-like enzyme